MKSPRTIYCIGRNYGAHAAELGNPIPPEPVVFLKPASSVASPPRLILPKALGRIDPEVEVVLELGLGGRDWGREEALAGVRSYSVGLDLTARDIQQEAKRLGTPWTRAKGFVGAAVVGNWVEGSPPLSDALQLKVNGELRQNGTPTDMLWSSSELLQFLSRHFLLEAGDWIFTGTPAGVGPVNSRDVLTASFGQSRLELTVELKP